MSEDNTRNDLILASSSPRRAQLLSLLSLNFEVKPVEVTEIVKPDPKETVITNARRKAEKVMTLDNSTLVLTADTVIDLDGKIIGKPSSKDEAFRLFKTFSGRTHRCTTAVCLAKFDFFEVRTEQTLVTFKNLRDSDILTYLDLVSPTDKAGGYGIQEMGWMLVKSLEGAFDNVMGLPLGKVLELLSLAKVRGLL